ncbi:MAG: three-Cys-motif partner protein TcmP [Pseudomonadota bacterium]
MEDHYFGGAWTEIKLDILRKYLDFYTKALRKQGFELLYIDAFAGTGSRTELVSGAPILGLEEKKISLDGSARIALNIEQPFDRYLFIETDSKRIKELEKLRAEFRNIYIKIENADANTVIAELASKPIWDCNKFRGVIFIDPYGMEVSWETLKAIKMTESFDVWYLFPTSGVCRQAARDYTKMEEYKKDALDKLFGTRDWEKAFYKKVSQQGLFEDTENIVRKLTINQIEEWVFNRLKTIFPHVSNPVVLPPSGAQLYSLFFCISNPSPKAIGLATKAANFIIKAH